MGKGVLLSVALLLAVAQRGMAQDVVSASSGVLHYFEGAVALDEKPVQHKSAVFPGLKNGSVLHTEKGRAELLLTPGVYLRMDEQSSVRMISNSLTDTRIELMDGSLILDNLNVLDNSKAPARDAVTLLYSGSEVRFSDPGIYRVDRFTGELQVFSGSAKVTHHGVSTSIDASHLYYFPLDLSMSKYGDGLTDEFFDWARNRSDVIADQVQMASAEQQDADDPDPNSIAGTMVPPLLSSPSYGASPNYGPQYTYSTPLYGSSANSLYWNPLTSYQGYPAIFVLVPVRQRPGGSRWPVATGLGNRPIAPIITRWPSPATTSSFSNPSAIRYPSRSPYTVGPSLARPVVTGVVTGVPRVNPLPAVPRPAAPHVVVMGHH